MTIPKGTRIRLTHCDDPYTKMTPGQLGTVTSHRNVGTDYEQIGVDWDNGSRLMLVPGVDRYEVVR